MYKSPVDDIAFDCSTLLQDTQEWAVVHGLLMYSKAEGKLTAAPYSLFPSPWPKSLYDLALTLATDYNLLIDRVAQDSEFLLQHLEKLTEDQFTANLVKILKTIKSEGVTQKVRLGIHRSDYMLHTGGTKWELKQVELNTIAASFSNLSTITSQLHKYIVTRYSSLLSKQYSPLNLAVNDSQTPIIQALATAFNLYKKQSSVIVMIVHPNETNTFDQRILEFLLWDKHNIKLLRRSLLDINERGKMDPISRILTIDEEEVAVVYFRAGYTPDDYPTTKEWDARLLIERSSCIKNPSVSYHLAGTKKIQQVLAIPGVLELFLDNKESIERIRRSFMGLYSLTEGEEGVSEIISKAKTEFADYVMKPQREGGGNNIYNKKIKESLENMSATERSGYILMDKIKTPNYSTIFVRNGELKKSLAISELGIYSVFVCDENTIYTNNNGGYLLRTKVSDSDEGGVAAGFAVLDSLYLTEE